MNWPSILRKSTGRVFRYTNEDTPVPKSSSANLQPRRFSSPMRKRALERLVTAAVSVISKHKAPAIAGSPTCCSTKSTNDCSFSEVPERFTASSGSAWPRRWRSLSSSIAEATTQRSITDMTL